MGGSFQKRLLLNACRKHQVYKLNSFCSQTVYPNNAQCFCEFRRETSLEHQLALPESHMSDTYRFGLFVVDLRLLRASCTLLARVC
jgi:hypothetical protein